MIQARGTSEMKIEWQNSESEWLLNSMCTMWREQKPVTLADWLTLCSVHLQQSINEQSSSNSECWGQQAANTAAKAIETCLISEVPSGAKQYKSADQVECIEWAIQELLKQVASLTAALGAHSHSHKHAAEKNRESSLLLSVLDDMEGALALSNTQVTMLNKRLSEAGLQLRQATHERDLATEQLQAERHKGSEEKEMREQQQQLVAALEEVDSHNCS